MIRRNTTVMKLAIILCLLAKTMFAEHQFELHPVYSQSNNHAGYALKIVIGNEGKEYRVLLDTTSAFLWVCGSQPLLHPFCQGKQFYSRDSTNSLSIKLPLPLIDGIIGRSHHLFGTNDDISIDSLNGGSVYFPNSPFGTPYYIDWPEWGNYQQIDGVFGLSPNFVLWLQKNVIGIFPFDSRNIISPENDMISAINFALPPLESNKKATITIGGRNHNQCNLIAEMFERIDGSILGFDVNFLAPKYRFKIQYIKMKDEVFMDPILPVFAYLSTIHPYINVPAAFMKQIAKSLNAQMDPNTKKYIVDCEGSFEPFEIFTTNNKYVIEPKYFIIKHDPNDERCELAFRSYQGIENKVELGIPFFHQYCVTLEPLHQGVGFAPLI